MSATTGTQRIVTVLFADVVGSTAIAERLGPERSKFLFDEVMGLITQEESDAVLERARACRDRDERLRLYRSFEKLWIGERAALVPLSYSRQLLLRRPYVHGLRLNPMRVFHLEQVVVTPPDQRSA